MINLNLDKYSEHSSEQSSEAMDISKVSEFVASQFINITELNV
jgi:hypothetical protein